MKTRNYFFLLIGILLISVFIVISFQRNDDATSSIFDEIKSDTLTQLVLETDMAALLSQKATSTYQKAKMIIQKTDGSADKYGLEVKTRGITRKQMCDFPPLKFKFDKEDLANRKLKKYKTLKLVTHCQEGASFEQVLLKEYLAYKLYNTLTEKSFEVQLVKVKYVDSKTLESVEHYGFVLEPKKEMADRVQAKLMQKSNKPLKQIDAEYYRVFTFFQYMIGNTDWNLSKQHNVKMLAADDDTHGPIPVPYDFDFSGLVNSPFAKPYPSLPIKKVTERFFQFRGKKNADFNLTFDLFQAKKRAFYDLCMDSDLLDDSVKMEMVAYLGSFYDWVDAGKQEGAVAFN